MLSFLSPVSVLAGCVAAVAAIAALWPLNGFGSAVVLFSFVIFGGAAELVRRLVSRPDAAAPTKAASAAASEVGGE